MVLNYTECKEKYGNAYQLNKAVDAGLIYKLEEGIYSEDKYESDAAILSKKYPQAVFTGVYAFYLHGLTDYVPESYALATKSKAAPIADKRVEQVYTRDDLLMEGATTVPAEGIDILVYDKERMLIELLRNKNKWPKDFYKEVLGRYRKIIESLEIWRIQEYIEKFPKSGMIRRSFDEEVL